MKVNGCVHQMLECCCMVWQKHLPHEHWRGDKCAAKCVDAVDFLMMSEQMKQPALHVALMAHA